MTRALFSARRSWSCYLSLCEQTAAVIKHKGEFGVTSVIRRGVCLGPAPAAEPPAEAGLCFIMNESWWVLIDTGPSSFDVRGVVAAARDERLLITALTPLTPPVLNNTTTPPRGGWGVVSHVRGTAETKRGQWGGMRTSTNQVPPSPPHTQDDSRSLQHVFSSVEKSSKSLKEFKIEISQN